ncbi:hypothetical protein [Alicyclobacillus acidiphilus]|uniref:hypothetical protein n=1 Tax=Alicyclobacillus acidiphilus TaxID=182455 RepID=UPI00082BEC98|nr:hypothetical protein [Alicyclobacillus acidiphilus]
MIRTFSLSDTDAVFQLWRDAGLSLGRTDTSEGLSKRLQRDPDLFLVAQSDGKVVGSVMGCYDGWRGWVVDFYKWLGFSVDELIFMEKWL